MSVLFRLGMWLAERGGGQETFAQTMLAAAGDRAAKIKADNERTIANVQMWALLRDVKLVDGLLSSGKVDEAQRYLRVAIIAASGDYHAPPAQGTQR
jgi:hypothetical protein